MDEERFIIQEEIVYRVFDRKRNSKISSQRRNRASAERFKAKLELKFGKGMDDEHD